MSRIAQPGWAAIDSAAADDLQDAICQLSAACGDQLRDLDVPPEGRFYRNWLTLEVGRVLDESPSDPSVRLLREWLPPGPYFDLEHAYVCQALECGTGEIVGVPTLRRLFHRWAGGQNFRGQITADRCYEFTHAVFYLTQFGRSTADLPYVAVLQQIGLRMLNAAIRDSQLDLVAELVATSAVLGAEDAPPVRTAWDRLNSAQLPTGPVPGPHFSINDLERMDGSATQGYLFATCFHTTLVACMAAVIGDRGTCTTSENAYVESAGRARS